MQAAEHRVLMGHLGQCHHHIVDVYARNPDDQIGVSAQQAVLRVYTRCFRTLSHPMQRIGFVVSPGFQVMSFAALSACECANT
jgi:hypothetical protein